MVLLRSSFGNADCHSSQWQFSRSLANPNKGKSGGAHEKGFGIHAGTELVGDWWHAGFSSRTITTARTSFIY